MWSQYFRTFVWTTKQEILTKSLGPPLRVSINIKWTVLSKNYRLTCQPARRTHLVAWQSGRTRLPNADMMIIPLIPNKISNAHTWRRERTICDLNYTRNGPTRCTAATFHNNNNALSLYCDTNEITDVFLVNLQRNFTFVSLWAFCFPLRGRLQW